jgi:hypothetical protein
MSAAAEAIKDFIEARLTGWEVQFGRWHDKGTATKHAVLRPVGGAMAGLVRRPQFTLMLIGSLNESAALPSIEAEEIIEAMRSESGGLVLMQAGEPVFSNTNDGRPVFEFAISTITN